MSVLSIKDWLAMLPTQKPHRGENPPKKIDRFFHIKTRQNLYVLHMFYVRTGELCGTASKMTYGLLNKMTYGFLNMNH